jgi:rhodanese-related sulfurtransferase
VRPDRREEEEASISARDAKPAAISVHRATLAEAGNTTPEISIEDVKRILDEGSTIVLDTRKRSQFEAGHIPGALNLDDAPLPEQVVSVEHLVDGNKDRALVLYCNGPFCRRSRELAIELHKNGFTSVSRFQLGIPIWRALGGPTVIELAALRRIFAIDQTAVYFDARSADAFAKGSLPGAHNVPVEDIVSGRPVTIPLPPDDFNTRIVIVGHDAGQARQLAEVLAKRPCHNVTYFAGSFDDVIKAVTRT